MTGRLRCETRTEAMKLAVYTAACKAFAAGRVSIYWNARRRCWRVVVGQFEYEANDGGGQDAVDGFLFEDCGYHDSTEVGG